MPRLKIIFSCLGLLVFFFYHTTVSASQHENCGENPGNQAICCSPGGGCYDVNAGDSCASEEDHCSQRERTPDETDETDPDSEPTYFVCDNTGYEDGIGRWRASGSVPSDNVPTCNSSDNSDNNWDGCTGGDAVVGGECTENRCGDETCSYDEYTSQSCTLDCGVRITNSGGSCVPLEFAQVKVPVNTGSAVNVIEGSSGTVNALDTNRTIDPLWGGLEKVWEFLRGPSEATQNAEDYFQTPNSRVFISGKVVGAPEGSEQLSPQGMEVGVDSYSKLNTRAKRVAAFTSSPEHNMDVPVRNTSDVTNFPTHGYQPQGKINVATNPNFFTRILNFASQQIENIRNFFSGKQEVDVSLTSCWYNDIETYQETRKIAGFGVAPKVGQAIGYDSQAVQNNSNQTNLTITSGNSSRTETVNLKTRGTASLYKSMETFINQLRPPGMPLFAFGTGTNTAIPTSYNNSPIANTTLVQANIDRINSNMSIYKEAGNRYQVPWQMLAAIHYLEGDNNPNQSLLNGGALCNNIDGSRGPNCANGGSQINDALDAALHLQGKVNNGLRTSGNSEAIVKDAFWGYNGRAYGSYDRSPYVMNNWDEAHRNMQWCGRLNSGETRCGIQTRDGAWKVYVLLNNANFDSEGNITRLNTGS